MTKKKGPKSAKTEFSVLRIERKKTRHLKGAVLAEALAKIASTKRKPLEAGRAEVVKAPAAKAPAEAVKA